MALNIMNAKKAGNTVGPVGIAQSKPEAIPVTCWINIGTESKLIDPSTGLPHFLSLSLGVAFDRCVLYSTETRNEDALKLNCARNNVHAFFANIFAGLQPGEEKRIQLGASGLCMQLRRASEKVDSTPIPEDENPHGVCLKLV